MAESDLLFDTWAWWEYLHGTSVGVSLRTRFLANGRFRIHTSVISLAELSARLHTDHVGDRVPVACGSIRRMSHIWDVTADLAQEVGAARARLRNSSSAASLADAIILLTARNAGARIVSADPAFRDVPGVIAR
ncbi:MAG: PIN domain-containing protein [Thermoplasmata archaeon]|nr:PIN domain-containing protein [Thermoplasmata archaeon]